MKDQRIGDKLNVERLLIVLDPAKKCSTENQMELGRLRGINEPIEEIAGHSGLPLREFVNLKTFSLKLFSRFVWMTVSPVGFFNHA